MKKILSLITCPDDLQAVFTTGHYETPLGLGLTADGLVLPLVLHESGAVVPASDVANYYGLFRDEDVDDVVSELQESSG